MPRRVVGLALLTLHLLDRLLAAEVRCDGLQRPVESLTNLSIQAVDGLLGDPHLLALGIDHEFAVFTTEVVANGRLQFLLVEAGVAEEGPDRTPLRNLDPHGFADVAPTDDLELDALLLVVFDRRRGDDDLAEQRKQHRLLDSPLLEEGAGAERAFELFELLERVHGVVDLERGGVLLGGHDSSFY